MVKEIDTAEMLYKASFCLQDLYSTAFHPNEMQASWFDIFNALRVSTIEQQKNKRRIRRKIQGRSV